MFNQIKQFLSSFSTSHKQDEYIFDPVAKFTADEVENKQFDFDVSSHLENFIATLNYCPSKNLREYWREILTTVVEDGYYQMPKPTQPHAWFIHERLIELEKAGYLDYIGFGSYTIGRKMWR
ncbi:hypothetical protein SAMN05443144_1337 [Fodinibius roseus]|uniref:Uncharacterized protein n=1 Tax=Fodinibius roseus TaxID=1194090 RepID=A0A1M5KML6_9BACT|nr:hypothetical protein [Fodinibius roseus]SHG53966.1 hypothetical protein SAMN05443144_1337 [Fodinibius roseus]